MKNHFLLPLLLLAAVLLPWQQMQAQETAVEGQSTEGKDFWVTFLQADQDANNTLQLQLSISSRTNANVTISNPYTGYSETVTVTAGQMSLVTLYNGNVLRSNARTAMATSGKVCYAVNSEVVDTCALHVVSDQTISLFATNYKKATFDATNVLPTASLRDEYYVQCYTPSDHGGVAKTQGSHFAIIAAEDNTVVEYCPTVPTSLMNEAQAMLDYTGDSTLLSPEQLAMVRYQYSRDTLVSPVLRKGQVYYVWTGMKDKEPGDLSGTYVRARGGKKIAVFQGCPHTNIPYQVKQRDHIFSQAMPTSYWGNTFVLTASSNRPSDIIRIMALNDQTDVFIDGQKVHTIDFSSDTKRYWEFEIGTQGTYAKSGSCVVTTSCPCAVHEFMTSQQYHGDKNSNGDPAMLWINPIEQQIDEVTFATYTSSNGTTSHYTNVVTDHPAQMTLDGNNISSQFAPVSGSSVYSYARISLGNAAGSHTLKCNGGNFIAHVYGFTENESYAYSAGGATKPLVQYVTINGQIFSPDSDNKLCGEDTVRFACVPDYEFEKIVWTFGDGTPDQTVTDIADSIVPHYYDKSGVYQAKVCIYRASSNLCAGQSAVSCIPITVTIGRYEFSINDIDIPCPEDGKQYIGKVFYSNPGGVDLHGNNVTVTFDDAARADGFRDSELTILPDYFQILIPATAKPETNYGIRLLIESDCGGADTTMHFMLNYDKDIITQRYNNVLGLMAEPFEGKTLDDFQWYRASDSTAVEGQVSANLNFYDLPYTEYKDDAYYVCFTVDGVKTCACAKAFEQTDKDYSFADGVKMMAYASPMGNQVFVNAQWPDTDTNTEATARWYTVQGKAAGEAIVLPNGGRVIPMPAEAGMYLLRVTIGKQTRTFKFIKQ